MVISSAFQSKKRNIGKNGSADKKPGRRYVIPSVRITSVVYDSGKIKNPQELFGSLADHERSVETYALPVIEIIDPWYVSEPFYLRFHCRQVARGIEVVGPSDAPRGYKLQTFPAGSQVQTRVHEQSPDPVDYFLRHLDLFRLGDPSERKIIGSFRKKPHEQPIIAAAFDQDR